MSLNEELNDSLDRYIKRFYIKSKKNIVRNSLESSSIKSNKDFFIDNDDSDIYGSKISSMPSFPEDEFDGIYADKAPSKPKRVPYKDSRELDDRRRRDLDLKLKSIDERSWSETLNELINQCDAKDSEIYTSVEISRQVFNRMVNDSDYHPSKPMALKIAIALKLDEEGAEELLNSAGYALSRNSLSDMIVRFFLHERIYNIDAINQALEKRGVKTL